MKVTVKEIKSMSKAQFNNKYVFLADDGNNYVFYSSELKEGQELEGYAIDKESKYDGKPYKQFYLPKKERPDGFKSYGRSPEESERIVRQNATERALEYFTCLGIRPEKLGEVLAVAEVFYQFDTGAVKVDAKKALKKYSVVPQEDINDEEIDKAVEEV